MGRFGFCTLTTADVLSDGDAEFRWRLARRSLVRHWSRSVWVLERQCRGAIHWHGIVWLRDAIDTGWDWGLYDECRAGRRVRLRACRALRGEWVWLRGWCAAHGLGRSELVPLRGSGAGAVRYAVSELAKGQGEIVGKRRVRFLGFLRHGRNSRRVFAQRSSLGPGGRVWREHVRMFAARIGCDSVEELSDRLGPRWGRIAMGCFGSMYLGLALEGDPEALQWWRSWMSSHAEDCRRARAEGARLCEELGLARWDSDLALMSAAAEDLRPVQAYPA